MALSQSALCELLDAIRAGGSVDVMREAMTLAIPASEAEQKPGPVLARTNAWMHTPFHSPPWRAHS